jgi:hypothetical protein
LWKNIRAGTNAFLWFFGMFLLFLLPFRLCWHEFIKKSYDVTVFTEPATGNSMVLHNNLPDPKTFESFVATLNEAIKNQHGNLTTKSKRGLIHDG